MEASSTSDAVVTLAPPSVLECAAVSPSQISWQKRILIYATMWLTINLAEAWGYAQWGIRHFNQRLSKRLEKSYSAIRSAKH